MKLKDYLRENGIKFNYFAKQIGCDNASMTRYTNGTSIPGKRRKALIEQLTGGEVTTAPCDWEVSEQVKWNKKNNMK